MCVRDRRSILVPVWLRKREVSLKVVLPAGTYAHVGVRAPISPPVYIEVVRECCCQSERDASEGPSDNLGLRGGYQVGDKGFGLQPAQPPSFLRPTSRHHRLALALTSSIMSISNKLSIRDLDLQSKKVLIRVDFNVPIQDGKITNPAVRRSPEFLRFRSSPPSSASSQLSLPSSMP